mgnify:CR=1 FL=1
MIKLNYEGKAYSLEYSRQSVRTMEAQGFNIEDVNKKPMTMIPMLFYGAFLKHHTGMKRKLVDEIYDSIADKSGLLSALIELYGETLSTLTDDAEESEGNASWEVVKG